MIGSRSLTIDRNLPNARRQIFSNEDEVAAIGAVRPLNMVVDAACRRARATGLRDQPRIAIIQAWPR